MCLLNGIIVYGFPNIIILFEKLVNNFLSIWELQGFINILLEHYMTILLYKNWQNKILEIRPKIYLFNNKAQKMIDDIFDKL